MSQDEIFASLASQADKSLTDQILAKQITALHEAGGEDRNIITFPSMSHEAWDQFYDLLSEHWQCGWNCRYQIPSDSGVSPKEEFKVSRQFWSFEKKLLKHSVEKIKEHLGSQKVQCTARVTLDGSEIIISHSSHDPCVKACLKNVRLSLSAVPVYLHEPLIRPCLLAIVRI